MKRTILALFAGAGLALTAVPVSADEAVKPAAPTTATPVVVTESGTTTARRGLLARFRDRRSTGAVMTAPATTFAPATVTPAPSTTVPTPLPSVKPASGTTTATSGVTTAAYTVPATPTTRTGLFSRMRNRGTTTMVEPMTMPMSAVVPASGTVTMTPVMTETATPTRTGLVARLRARRG